MNYGIVHSFSLESRACCITASSYSCPRKYVDVGSGREQAVTMVSLVVVEAEVSLQLVVVVVPGIGLRFSIGLPMLAAFCLPFLMKKTKIFRKRFLSKLVCKNKIKCKFSFPYKSKQHNNTIHTLKGAVFCSLFHRTDD